MLSKKSDFIKGYLKSDLQESRRTKTFRWLMNLYPMFFGTGGKILFWSADWSEVHLRLKLNIWTRNYVGTIFGGSLFAATDPFYMLMLFHMLGKDYVAWDKAAQIKFKRPAKNPLYAKLKVTAEIVEKIKSDIAQKGETTHDFVIQWVDADQVVFAELVRTVYAASKIHYKEKQHKKQINLQSKI